MKVKPKRPHKLHIKKGDTVIVMRGKEDTIPATSMAK